MNEITWNKLNNDDLNKIQEIIDLRDNKLNKVELELSIGTAKIAYNMGVETSSYFKSNSRSVYFKVNRSIIRVSDHWSQNEEMPRSRKLNCGLISNEEWNLNESAYISSSKGYPKKYGSRKMVVGITSIAKLRKSGCQHF